MLTSLVISFRPASAISLPRDLGRASHAQFLRLIGSYDAALAETLHAGDGPRPFTCSNVSGGRRTGAVLNATPEDVLWLRYCGLNESVGAVLKRIAAQPPAELELDGVAMPVQAATLDPEQHPRASQTSYEALAAPYLLAHEPPDSRIRLRFVAPTAFKARGQTVPLPLPGSVFGSLVDRWNAQAPIQLSPDARRFGEECMALSRFVGRTRHLRGKDGGGQIGFIGEAVFSATNRDRYWLGIMNVLADFAQYAGVGYQTTQGMGQVRRIVEARQEHP